MKNFPEVHEIVKKHFPTAEYNEMQHSYIITTRRNRKDIWDKPETLEAMEREMDAKYPYASQGSSWDSNGNVTYPLSKMVSRP